MVTTRNSSDAESSCQKQFYYVEHNTVRIKRKKKDKTWIEKRVAQWGSEDMVCVVRYGKVR